jgi:hypothetical protein
MNGGVFLFKPSLELHGDMLLSMNDNIEKYLYREAEQGFFNFYFNSTLARFQYKGACCLNSNYNVQKTVYKHIPSLFNLSNIKILHYVGEKPWTSWSSSEYRQSLKLSKKKLRSFMRIDSWDSHEYKTLHDLWKYYYYLSRFEVLSSIDVVVNIHEKGKHLFNQVDDGRASLDLDPNNKTLVYKLFDQLKAEWKLVLTFLNTVNIFMDDRLLSASTNIYNPNYSFSSLSKANTQPLATSARKDRFLNDNYDSFVNVSRIEPQAEVEVSYNLTTTLRRLNRIINIISEKNEDEYLLFLNIMESSQVVVRPSLDWTKIDEFNTKKIYFWDGKYVRNPLDEYNIYSSSNHLHNPWLSRFKVDLPEYIAPGYYPVDMDNFIMNKMLLKAFLLDFYMILRSISDDCQRDHDRPHFTSNQLRLGNINTTSSFNVDKKCIRFHERTSSYFDYFYKRSLETEANRYRSLLETQVNKVMYLYWITWSTTNNLEFIYAVDYLTFIK